MSLLTFHPPLLLCNNHDYCASPPLFYFSLTLLTWTIEPSQSLALNFGMHSPQTSVHFPMFPSLNTPPKLISILVFFPLNRKGGREKKNNTSFSSSCHSLSFFLIVSSERTLWKCLCVLKSVIQIL